MLCGCLEPLSSSPEGQQQQQQRQEGAIGDTTYVSSFPGNRRCLVKTAGNALVEHDPSIHGSSATNAAANSTTGNYGANVNGAMDIAVTIPDGVCGGQTIHVSAPDGRILAAKVPDGMQAGASFIVRFPATSTTTGGSQSLPSPLPVPLPVPISPTNEDSPPSVNDIGMKAENTVLVKVPPGTAPGTTMYVKIPNSEHMVSAQVPPGVSEFHVTYDDSAVQEKAQLLPQQQQLLPPPIPVPVQPPSQSVEQKARDINGEDQKLILVKVPNGIAAGTTLHVQVPGETQMIAAQVPPDVEEFHVAYTPTERR